jgi:hypothetical protein
MINEFEAVGGTTISWGQQRTGSEPAPVPLHPSPDLGSNTGRHGGKPATNSLSYDTAHCTNIRVVNHCAVKKCGGVG